nr:hypothetical protein [Candidatus Sigynarchaeota archaeon]
MQEISIVSDDVKKYITEVEATLLGGATSKRCMLRAQAWHINTLAEIVGLVQLNYSKRIKVEDITIDTIKELKVNRDRAKNISMMKVVLVRIDKIKE